MTSHLLRLSLACFLPVAAVGVSIARSAAAPVWQPTQWNGEDALASVSQGWRAIVSLARGRLVHFGPADREVNLLFSTPTRDDPAGWAGHRLWLGPQKTWPKIWPPAAVWEHEPAAHVTERDGRLELSLASAGDGWPELTRFYAWDGPRLVCGAELRGGTRDAQVISIFQVPRDAIVSLAANPEPRYRAGYVQLPSSAGPFATKFPQPPHVLRDADAITLRNVGAVVKLGFRPQTITARVAGFLLHVGRGAEAGRRVAEPDEGFHTQVYLGGPKEPFIELEQLTSEWSPDAPASASVVLFAETAAD